MATKIVTVVSMFIGINGFKQFKVEQSPHKRTCFYCKCTISENKDSVYISLEQDFGHFPISHTMCLNCFIQKYKDSLLKAIQYKIDKYELWYKEDVPLHILNNILRLKGIKGYINNLFSS